MVVVVAMGYSRQGVALGLAMLGITKLAKGNIYRFILAITIAATFHKSALLLIPVAVLATPRGRVVTGIWVGITGLLLYWTLLADSVDSLVASYITAGYQSEGAVIRIAMNALPAALLILFRKQFEWTNVERNLWTTMAGLAILTTGVLVISPSSTAVDRVALYLIPLQLYVFARVPDLVGREGERRLWVVLSVSYYALVLFVWLNFATHSAYWLPYRFYPFELL